MDVGGRATQEQLPKDLVLFCTRHFISVIASVFCAAI